MVRVIASVSRPCFQASKSPLYRRQLASVVCARKQVAITSAVRVTAGSIAPRHALIVCGPGHRRGWALRTDGPGARPPERGVAGLPI